LHALVLKADSGQPGWLARVDRWSGSQLLHHGTSVAVVFAALCVLIALCVFVRPQVTQMVLVVAMVAFALIWVATENFGGILAGGATDPNSGLLVALLILTYWPLTGAHAPSPALSATDMRAPALREI
jgi:hypothetical protein